MEILLIAAITALFITGMVLLGREALTAWDEWRSDRT